MAKSAGGDYVLIGVGQTSLLSGKEHFQETGSRWVGYNTWHQPATILYLTCRFSCFIQWVADYYNLSADSSANVLSWSTACPAQGDISWGSIGNHYVNELCISIHCLMVAGSLVAGIPGASAVNGKVVLNKKPSPKAKAKPSGSHKKELSTKSKVSSGKPNFLRNYPGCGKSVQVQEEELFLWQGSRYAVTLKTKEEKFISSVALLSVTSKEHPHHPTVIVSSGGIIDPYKFDLVLDVVKVLGDNEITATDFKEMVNDCFYHYIDF